MIKKKKNRSIKKLLLIWFSNREKERDMLKKAVEQ